MWAWEKASSGRMKQHIDWLVSRMGMGYCSWVQIQQPCILKCLPVDSSKLLTTHAMHRQFEKSQESSDCPLKLRCGSCCSVFLIASEMLSAMFFVLIVLSILTSILHYWKHTSLPLFCAVNPFLSGFHYLDAFSPAALNTYLCRLLLDKGPSESGWIWMSVEMQYGRIDCCKEFHEGFFVLTV